MAKNYVEVKEDGTTGWVGPLPKTFKNVSGFDRMTNEQLAVHNWFPMVDEVEAYDQKTHYLGVPHFRVENGNAIFKDNVIAFTAEEMVRNKYNDWKGTMDRHDSIYIGSGVHRSLEELVDILVAKFPTLLDSLPTDSTNLRTKYENKKADRAIKPPSGD